MRLHTRYSVQTHVGHKRKVNEDAVLALPQQNIWLVSDGMGGHEAGDYASRLIADMAAGIPLNLEPGDRLHALRDSIQEAHRLIRQEAAQRGVDVMGATVVGLLLADGHFAALWAGDSRLYRLRDGAIEMLTSDHSVVAALVETGQMTWDEAEHHPQSNAITRAVGVGETLELDKRRGQIEPGDRVTLTSAHGRMEQVVCQPFDLPPGSAMAYFPEANVLVGRARDARSKTPAFKSTSIRVEASG